MDLKEAHLIFNGLKFMRTRLKYFSIILEMDSVLGRIFVALKLKVKIKFFIQQKLT
jgi:hypothetical protein